MSDGSIGHGTVVITDNQTNGKGQRGNHWESQPGKNLTFSILIKPDFLTVSKQFELTVVTSLALITTLSGLGVAPTWIKWPNDIYTENGKIAGILIENIIRANQLEWSILGIGLNINQTEFEAHGATSIRLHLKKQFDLQMVLDKLLQQLGHHYGLVQTGSIEALWDLYARSLLWVGQNRVFRDSASGAEFYGRIQQVTDDGRLLIRSSNEDLIYDFKQVEFVR